MIGGYCFGYYVLINYKTLYFPQNVKHTAFPAAIDAKQYIQPIKFQFKIDKAAKIIDVQSLQYKSTLKM